MPDESLPLSKYTKEETGYRLTSVVYPCRTCIFFGIKEPGERRTSVDPSTCDVVEGDINPGATCILWRHFLSPGAKRRPFPPVWFQPGGFLAKFYSQIPTPNARRKM